MPTMTTGVTRRRAMILTSVTIVGAALPAWPEVAIAAVEPTAPMVPVVPNPPIGEGLSQLFRHREWWLRKFWNRYLFEVEEYRTAPVVHGINSRRLYFQRIVIQVVRTVPATQRDREVKEYAHALVLALLADFPEVPWWPEITVELEKCLAWHAAGGISPSNPEAVRTKNQTIA